MQPQEVEPPGYQEFMDAACRTIAAIVILIATCSVLIMGIFANIAGTPIVASVGTCIILGSLAILLLTFIAQLASRRLAFRARPRRERSALVVSAMVFCAGIPLLTIGIWECMPLLIDATSYQEANVEPSHAIPQL